MSEKSNKQLPSWLKDELEKMNKKKQESSKNETKLNVISCFYLKFYCSRKMKENFFSHKKPKVFFSNDDEEEEDEKVEKKENARSTKITPNSKAQNSTDRDKERELQRREKAFKHIDSSSSTSKTELNENDRQVLIVRKATF